MRLHSPFSQGVCAAGHDSAWSRALLLGCSDGSIHSQSVHRYAIEKPVDAVQQAAQPLALVR